MNLSRRPPSRPELSLTDIIPAAEKMPIVLRIGALLKQPVQKGDELAEAYGKALIRAGDVAVQHQDRPAACAAFLAAAKLFPENDPQEVYAANYFARLARQTRVQEPVLALQGAIHYAVGVLPNNSQRLVDAVTRAFVETFKAVPNSECNNALHFTLRGTSKALENGAHPRIIKTMIGAIAEQLPQYAEIDAAKAAGFRTRFASLKQVVLNKDRAMWDRRFDHALVDPAVFGRHGRKPGPELRVV